MVKFILVVKNQEMAKKNYPSKRKPAATWECPICKKVINIRGKSGHLKLVHEQFLLSKKHDPFAIIERKIVPKRRPLAKADVRNLLSNIKYLISNEIPNDLLNKRETYLKCEFIIRELEIQFNCTLKDALNKFPE